MVESSEWSDDELCRALDKACAVVEAFSTELARRGYHPVIDENRRLVIGKPKPPDTTE